MMESRFTSMVSNSSGKILGTTPPSTTTPMAPLQMKADGRTPLFQCLLSSLALTLSRWKSIKPAARVRIPAWISPCEGKPPTLAVVTTSQVHLISASPPCSAPEVTIAPVVNGAHSMKRSFLSTQFQQTPVTSSFPNSTIARPSRPQPQNLPSVQTAMISNFSNSSISARAPLI